LEARKIDNFSIEVDKVTPAITTTVTYDRAFLEQQRKDIIKSSDNFVAARMKEIQEIDELLRLCDEQGVILKPIEPAAETLE
jgi:histidinol-phosphate/aromatic aminotransferase/cobyric acid decarboxylase-like protein